MAEVGIGMKGYLGYGVESTYGTIVSRTLFQEINSESIVKNRELVESASIYRAGILNTKVVQGAVSVAGDIEFDAQYEGWETLLKHVFGAVQSTQQGSTSAYRHNFTIADVLPTGLSFEVFRDSSNFASESNKAFIYSGCKITSMTFSAAVSELLKISMSIFGQNEERRTKTSETFNTSRLAVYHQGVLKWNTVDREVSAFSVTLNNSLDPRPKLGSQLSREPLRNAKVEVSGSFTAEFSSWAMYDDFLNAAERVLNVHFDGPLIQNGYPYYIDMNVNVGIITGLRVNLNAPGRLILELDFKGYRTTSINELVIELQNTVTSVT